MGERKIHIIDACAHDDMRRGNVVIDTPATEIVIAYDDDSGLRRSTALTRAQALDIAQHIEGAFRRLLAKKRGEGKPCRDADAAASA